MVRVGWREVTGAALRSPVGRCIIAEPMDSGETKREYFDMLAKLGVTKHVGSLDATNEILELCSLEPGMTVLDVGCGVGHTPKILAQWHGCRVIGIDLLPRMVVKARGVARRAGVGDQVALATADAQALPFAGGTFDLVIVDRMFARRSGRGSSHLVLL